MSDRFRTILKITAMFLAVLTLVVSVFASDTGFFTFLGVLDLILVLAFFIYTVLTKGLLAFLARRLGETAVTLLVIVTLVFTLLRLLPGGPFDEDKKLPPEVQANIDAKYHLDKPLVTQYMYYLSGLVRGDLGESYKYLGRNVSDIIADSFPNSFRLGFYALLVSFIVGIPLGVIAASKHNTWWDTSSMFLAMSGVSVPSFLVAAILIMIFSFTLKWLPPALWEGPQYYILPVITLGIRPAAIIARLTRSAVLDVIQSDFVRTAHAKGLQQKVVLFKHVLRNSLIPVITYSGPLIADILSGAFIIEHIFAVPGMGKHLIMSVSNRDYPLVLGVSLVFSVILVFANLLVDLTYAIVDPRMRLN